MQCRFIFYTRCYYYYYYDYHDYYTALAFEFVVLYAFLTASRNTYAFVREFLSVYLFNFRYITVGVLPFLVYLSRIQILAVSLHNHDNASQLRHGRVKKKQ